MPREKDGRTKQFPIRVSEEELEQLHRTAKAAGYGTTGDWARRVLLGFDPGPWHKDREEEKGRKADG